jgi:sec-independent protein translocase protein TatA
VFNGIGPPELLIVLVIVLVIFGPKRLPGLGRSLGSGMREFKDSITGKSRDDDDDDDDTRESRSDSETRSQANAALGRPDEDPAPVEGEVVSERTRS